METARTPLARVLTATLAASVALVLLTGCGFLFGPGAGPGAPRFNPSGGTYDYHVSVEFKTDRDVQLYVSTDPDASFLDFEHFWDRNYHVTRDMTLRAYVIDDNGQRSGITEEQYVIGLEDGLSPDSSAPVISSPGLWQENTGDSSYDIYWDAWDGDDEREANPSDDTTAWWDLEFIVYNSPVNNIETLEDAEDNGTILQDWTTQNTGEVDHFYYGGANRGERRYVNVFVRDAAGNAAAYGAVLMQTLPPPPDIYLGSISSNDKVLLNPRDGVLDVSLTELADAPPNALEQTISLALADINDDGFDDLVACYQSGGKTYQGWFAARGNGSFEDVAEHELSDVDVASEIIVADLDRNGAPDLVFANEPDGVRLGIYNLDMTELFTVNVAGVDAMTVGDINGDGFPDLVTADTYGGGGVTVLVNDGGCCLEIQDQTWTDDPAIVNPVDVLLVDLNQDKFDDLVVAAEDPDLEGADDQGQPIQIYYGSETGIMAAEQDENAWWGAEDTRFLEALDWGVRDGRLDLVFSNQTEAPGNHETRIYRNYPDADGTPMFQFAHTLGSGMTTPTGLAVGDFNDDEYPDIIETFVGQPGTLYINDYGGGHQTGSTPIGAGDESALAVGRLR